jgi:NAD+ synthase
MTKSAKDLLRIDEKDACAKAEDYIRRWVNEKKVNGVLMGLSGGIDSALLAALAVRTLGKDKVTMYFLQDKNSEKDSLDKARVVADWLGLELKVDSIEKAMREREKGASFFRWISSMPNFLLPVIVSMYYMAVGETPYITTLRKNEIKKSKFKKWVYEHIMDGVERMFDGPCIERRVVLGKIAAERNLLLIGAGNKSEDLTGWFTIEGVDNMPCSPIANLYKAQVNQLSAYLGIPDAVLKRKPTADVLKGATDALALGMDYGKIDVILYGIENGLSDEEITEYGISIPEINRVRRIYALSAWKRSAPKE